MHERPPFATRLPGEIGWLPWWPMTPAWLVLRGLLLGLGAAVPIGPVNIEIARRTLRGGFWAGVAIGSGAVTVDVGYAIVTSLSLRPGFADQPWVRGPLLVGGIALLAWLGTMSLWAAVKVWRGGASTAAQLSQPPAPSLHGGYLTGLLITLINPMTLGFWFVAVPAQTAALTQQPGRDLPWVCTGVFLGALGWAVFFAAVLSLTGRVKRPGWLAAADAVGGIVLLGFAAIAFLRSIGPYL